MLGDHQGGDMTSMGEVSSEGEEQYAEYLARKVHGPSPHECPMGCGSTAGDEFHCPDCGWEEDPSGDERACGCPLDYHLADCPIITGSCGSPTYYSSGP